MWHKNRLVQMGNSCGRGNVDTEHCLEQQVLLQSMQTFACVPSKQPGLLPPSCS